MSRPPRHALLPEAPATIHFIWRCHNRDFLLGNDDVKSLYLKLLTDHKQRYGIEIYGYAIMTNHFHAVLRLPARSSWQCFARTVNSKLATHINRCRDRCGQVVMDRPRTIVLERDEDVLATLRYIELNPVRAGMVRRPRDYLWSSYRHHAQGKADAAVDECPAITALGDNEHARREAFVALFGALRHSPDRHRRADLVEVYFVGSAVWQMAQLTELRRLLRANSRPPSS